MQGFNAPSREYSGFEEAKYYWLQSTFFTPHSKWISILQSMLGEIYKNEYVGEVKIKKVKSRYSLSNGLHLFPIDASEKGGEKLVVSAFPMVLEKGAFSLTDKRDRHVYEFYSKK